MRLTGLISRARAAQPRSSTGLGRWIEAILLIVLAIQIARLLWALVASTGPFGDWHARQPAIPGTEARVALFSAFDPFYRQAAIAPGGVQQVTSLPLQLYGIRINEGSGLGSAIIADESGVQQSFAVGEEIAPGVTLASVAYDHVTISRGGATETLYINQSSEAPTAAPAPTAPGGIMPTPPPGTTMPNPPPVVGEGLAPDALQSGIAFIPRTEKGAITGIVVSAQGNNGAFARAGFQPGDIIAQVNGTPVRDASDIARLRNDMKPGARFSFTVERGATTIPIALIIPDKK
ncbi:MAG: PDZ domain-containing protein [Sphingobium sp.]|nr:PDZ domain-containing protein [Sphingobium sp.]